jgi:hypothetical protein
MPIAVRLASDDDFRAFFGKEPPAVWNALAGFRDGRIVGMGGVVYSDDGVAVGFLDVVERPSVTIHKSGLRFMAAMKRVGEPYVITYCDGKIARAAAWLDRLNFRKTDQTVDGQDVWKWEPT